MPGDAWSVSVQHLANRARRRAAEYREHHDRRDKAGQQP